MPELGVFARVCPKCHHAHNNIDMIVGRGPVCGNGVGPKRPFNFRVLENDKWVEHSGMSHMGICVCDVSENSLEFWT